MASTLSGNAVQDFTQVLFGDEKSPVEIVPEENEAVSVPWDACRRKQTSDAGMGQKRLQCVRCEGKDKSAHVLLDGTGCFEIHQAGRFGNLKRLRGNPCGR